MFMSYEKFLTVIAYVMDVLSYEFVVFGFPIALYNVLMFDIIAFIVIYFYFRGTK